MLRQVQEGQANPNKWKVGYGSHGETPVFEQFHHDGRVAWYATGTAVATVAALPIVVRMRWVLDSRVLRWVESTPKREEMAMALRKVAAAAAAPGAPGPGVSDRGDFPLIIEQLVETKYPDGSARVPGALIIVADVGGWRGCISDKDNDRTLWKAAASVLDLLTALETALAEDDPTAWRQASGGQRKPRKRG